MRVRTKNDQHRMEKIESYKDELVHEMQGGKAAEDWILPKIPLLIKKTTHSIHSTHTQKT